MNVTMNKTGDVSARLIVKVEENDYKDKVVKQLKEIGRQRAIPGFRKGHVPMPTLQRMFGTAVTSDIINDEVYNAVMTYLKDNKVDVLGQPVPVDVKELDLKNDKEFIFEYDLALAPEIKLEVNKDITIPYYAIKVDDTMIDEQDKAMRKRFGSQVPAEVSDDDAIIKGALMQLNEDGTVNENEGAIQVVAGIVYPALFSDKEEAKLFTGKKVGDKVRFNPYKSCNGNPVELASMLNVDRAIAADVKSDFEMAISEIIVVKPAELNEEYFTSTFGADKVHNEEEYREAVKSMIASELAGNSQMLFRRDAQKTLLEKAGKPEFAAEILKKWLMLHDKNITAENVDETFANMLPGLEWEIVSGDIARKANIEVNEDDMLNAAKAMARQQFAQYGMYNLTDDIFENYAKKMLEDRNMAQRIYQQVADTKLFTAIYDMVNIDRKEVSLDEFKAIIAKD